MRAWPNNVCERSACQFSAIDFPNESFLPCIIAPSKGHHVSGIERNAHGFLPTCSQIERKPDLLNFESGQVTLLFAMSDANQPDEANFAFNTRLTPRQGVYLCCMCCSAWVAGNSRNGGSVCGQRNKQERGVSRYYRNPAHKHRKGVVPLVITQNRPLMVT
jgi:hypothetical protein